MDFIERLNWRYAVKKFDGGKKLSKEQLDTILESVRLSPSSFGLQPYRLILVEDQEKRRALGEHSMSNREKVINASNLVVFAVETEMNAVAADRFVGLISDVRGIPRSDLTNLEGMLNGLIDRFSDPKDFQGWAKRQAYISIGIMLTVCAGLGIDACPMEGFIADRYDEILDLKAMGLTTAVIAVLGYRGDDDSYGKLKKVRRPMNEFLIRI